MLLAIWFFKHLFAFISAVLALILVCDWIFDVPFLYFNKGKVVKNTYNETVVKIVSEKYVSPFDAIICNFSYKKKKGEIIKIDYSDKIIYNTKCQNYYYPCSYKDFIFKNKKSYKYIKLQEGIVCEKIMPNVIIIVIIFFSLLFEVIFACSVFEGGYNKKDFINVLTFLGYKKDDIELYINSISIYNNFSIKDYKKWKKFN